MRPAEEGQHAETEEQDASIAQVLYGKILLPSASALALGGLIPDRSQASHSDAMKQLQIVPIFPTIPFAVRVHLITSISP